MLHNIIDKLSPITFFCKKTKSLPNDQSTYGERSVIHYEFEYITSGSGYIITNDIPIPTKAGYLNFRFPGMRVEGMGVYTSIFLMFHLNKSNDVYKEFEEFPIVFTKINREYLNSLFNELTNQNLNTIPGKIAAKCCIFDLLKKMCEHSSEDMDHIYINRFSQNDNIIRSISYLQANYHDDITITQLSDIAGYSTYHYIREFKKLTGMTPIAYLKNYRTRRAKYLISNTKLPIAEIALNCGFNSYPYFFQTFKSFYKMSPNQYRQSYCLR